MSFLVWGPHTAFADFIQVKHGDESNGEIIKSGKIMTVTDEEVVFKDSWGDVQTYPRTDVTYLEESKEAVLRPKKKQETEDKEKAPDAQAAKAGHAPESVYGKTKTLYDKFASGRKPAAAYDESTFVGKINSLSDRILRMVSEYIYMDTEGSSDSVNQITTRLMESKGSNHTNMGLGVSGMVIVFLGLVMLILFSLQLLYTAFQESFLWGFIFLSNLLAGAAPLFGGFAGLLLIIPHLLTIYFVITRWGLTRKPVVKQIFCLNLVLIGGLMLCAA
jgi:hypothetical protein